MKDYLKPLATIVSLQAQESMMDVNIDDENDVGTGESLGDW